MGVGVGAMSYCRRVQVKTRAVKFCSRLLETNHGLFIIVIVIRETADRQSDVSCSGLWAGDPGNREEDLALVASLAKIGASTSMTEER